MKNNKFENFNELFIDNLYKLKVMNDLMKKGLVPVIRNGKLIMYSVRLNEKFDDLRKSILKELSEIYTLYGIFDMYNIAHFNSAWSHVISLNQMTLSDVQKYRLRFEKKGKNINEYLTTEGVNLSSYDNIDECVYDYLIKSGFKACTIEEYPRIYQIMNEIGESINLDFITDYLCQFVSIDYNYSDEIVVSTKSAGISSNETFKEKNLSIEQRIELLKELYNCFEISKLKDYRLSSHRFETLELARRNTEIINTEGFQSLINTVVSNKKTFKNKIKVKK